MEKREGARKIQGPEGMGHRGPRALWSDGQEGARLVPRVLVQPTWVGWWGHPCLVGDVELSWDVVGRGLGQRSGLEMVWVAIRESVAEGAVAVRKLIG